ncbi:MAG: S8 family serine peptidase [Planctomycetota bacterium]
MGYHYRSDPNSVLTYVLETQVFVSDLYPRGTLSVTTEPNNLIQIIDPQTSHTLYKFKQGTEVELKANPDPSFRVKRWVGTDDDLYHYDETNTIAMTGTSKVQVEFELAVPKHLFVPSEYTTIEEAVNAARSGDTIILAPRPGDPYMFEATDGIDFGGRQLVLTSVYPDDPVTVANTVIDCQGTRGEPRRAFHFHNGEDPNSIIQGITIQNGYYIGDKGLDGAIPDEPFPPGQNPEAPNRANSGEDAFGSAYGGAILCEDGSSPSIRNCVFRNCTVVGAIGGDGANGFSGSNGDDGQSGGHGGSAIGNGAGGAIAIRSDSHPIVDTCTFENNTAIGAFGGDGGDGGNGGGNGKGTWGGDGGDAESDGRGGAIFVATGCQPVITECVFRTNSLEPGSPGEGGLQGAGSNYPEPWHFFGDGSDGYWTMGEHISGGAIYIEKDNDLTLDQCVFADNSAKAIIGVLETEYYLTGGAVYTEPNNTLEVNDCFFGNNLGCALFVGDGADVVVNDSEFIDNSNHIRQPSSMDIPLESYIEIYETLFPELFETNAGAVYVGADGSRVEFNDTVFRGNMTIENGGAVNAKSDTVLKNCTFSENTAQGNGGAIDAYFHIPDPNVKTLMLTLDGCEFANNVGGLFGGGIHCKHVIANVADSCFINNTAQTGGGAYFSRCDLTLTDSRICSNTATGLIYNHHSVVNEGFGGGLACMSTTVSIVGCQITDNKTTGGQSEGGGVYLTGTAGLTTHEFLNCLIAGNESGRRGGGFYCGGYDTVPVIENCTFASNSTAGLGGGIYCMWSSYPTVRNSIFFDCNQYAVYEEEIGGSADTSHTLFFGNSEGDYFDAETGTSYTGAAQINSISGNFNNIDTDPVFLPGPLGDYYLNQVSSGAVDSGSASAASLGYDVLTTDSAGALDTGIVDMGFHYPDPATLDQHLLTVTVVDDHGTYQIEPLLQLYYEGMLVKVTAFPDDGYRLYSWSGGTIDDNSEEAVNYVLLDSDKQIEIRFDQPRTLMVGLLQEYPSIQAAIGDAEDGDIVMIEPGNYIPTSYGTIDFLDRDITLTSMNPDDPAVVAATVMDGYNFYLVDAGSESIIQGITFTHMYMYLRNSSPVIRNCVYQDCNFSGGNGASPPSSDGANGGSIKGGAMEMYESSPKIINCSFDNCSGSGGDGGEGDNGNITHPEGYDGGWAGRAYGGAVYASFGSHPEFIDCTFSNNSVQGGIGGDGGDGLPLVHGGRGGNWLFADYIEDNPPNWVWWDGWEYGDKDSFSFIWFDEYDWDLWQKWFGLDEYINWDDFLQNYEVDLYDNYEDHWRYGGYGGAAYCEYDSSIKFRNCIFTDNFAASGVSGVGGSIGLVPTRRFNLPTAGGAVYAAFDSRLEFNDCVITGNTASYEVTGDEPADDSFFSYGGGVAADYDCEVILKNTRIGENAAALGGGICVDKSEIQVTDCNIIENIAYHGGGLYTTPDTAGAVSQTAFNTNRAILTTMGFDGDVLVPGVQLGGQGGGYFCYASSLVDVFDCEFRNNGALLSGGGIYYGGSDQENLEQPTLFNCLLTGNHAGRDGGGVSVNWHMDMTISNCTISHNAVTGAFGETLGFGGGLYASYSSYVTVIDSIIWDNIGINGSQIAVGSGDQYAPYPSTVDISYSDVGPITDPNGVIEIPFDPTDPMVAEPSENTPPEQVVEPEEIAEEIAANGTAKVIVTLVEPDGIRDSVNWDSPSEMLSWQAQVDLLQDAVLNALSAGEWTLRQRYQNFAGFSGEVTQAGFDELVAHPNVKYIEPVRPIHRMMAQGITLANATSARQFYDGTGIAVAIVDDAVDYTHPALGGGGFPNDKVIGGYDFGANDADPAPIPGSADALAHGTSVSGIAAGSADEAVQMEDYIGGVAPNAKIYALKIADDEGGLSIDAALAAWDWCLTHRLDDPANPLLVINNSWGTNAVTDDPQLADTLFPSLTIVADNLVSAGVAILAASGNGGAAGQGISHPAAMSKVISVGAVYDASDVVTEYSNTSSILDILAPADPLYTTDIVGEDGYNELGDYFPEFNGTSAATPFAVGCIASIQSAAKQQLDRYLAPVEIKTLLIDTGDPVTDTKVEITKPRVNLGMAIASIGFGLPIHVEDGCMLSGWDPVNFEWDPAYHMLVDDPNFVGDYFLSQISGGQTSDSNCVDAGSDSAFNIGLWTYTTSIGMVPDGGQVDLGYHHRIGADGLECKRLDHIYDGRIDLADYARLGLYWMDSCVSPDWCDGVDINTDGIVGIFDFGLFMDCWLHEDLEPPSPNPAEWARGGAPMSDTGIGTIRMRAKLPDDNWARTDKIGQPDEWKYEYQFERVYDGQTTITDWGSSEEYVDSGLTVDDIYTYRVRIRDLSVNLNETDWSIPVAVIAGLETNPPEPNPSLWATLEHDGVNGLPRPYGVDTIIMQAYAATDPEGNGVEYYFECVDGFGSDSGWQVSPFYQDNSLPGLGSTATYTVKTRDTSLNQNEGLPSVPASATTEDIDSTPPDPNPAQHEAGYPFAWEDPLGSNIYYHFVRAVEATDDSGVEYRFVCNYSDYSSGGNEDEDPITGERGEVWRNVDNVGAAVPGTFSEFWPNPGGANTYQEPQEYRVKTVGKHGEGDAEPFTWYIITRDRVEPIPNTGDPSTEEYIVNP